MKKGGRKASNENAIVESGGFLFVLTAEKTPVINDLGPQYQNLHHMEKRGGAGRALQLVPAFQMQLVRVANFLLFYQGELDEMQMRGSGEQTAFKGFKKCIIFCF